MIAYVIKVKLKDWRVNMKKYVDYSSLIISISDTIKEEQNKIKGWRRWLAFFVIMLILSILPLFYFSSEALTFMYLVTVYSLLGIVVSIVFINMYKGFIKSWENFELEQNEGWGELEDKHNKDWNEYFEKWRSSSYAEETSVRSSEEDVISGSKKSVKKLLEDRK